MTDPTRAALLALAERCEQASGPDLELDADIWRAVDREKADCFDRGDAPRFTASIDDALTLVPDGWKWSLHSADHAGPPCAYCVPNMGRLPWPAWVDDIHAATAPLALCAAALRARAMEDGNGE